MTFFTIICKNLLRRRTRSLLTIAGIAIGIGAVVALASLAWGFESSWVRTYTARGTDMIVTKVTSQSPIPAPFAEEREKELLALPHVVQASGLLTDLISVEDAPTVLVFGWKGDSYLWAHLHLVGGRWPKNDNERAVVLGSVAVDMLNKTIGSDVQIETDTFKVCGIFESAALAENGAVIMRLPQMQRVTEQEGKVNFINIKLAPGTTPEQEQELRHTIAANMTGFKAFTADEVAQNNSGIQVAKGMSWATSGIALFIGAIFVMNTVLMSVFERMHEIGILLAIGWRRSRILRMILYESIVLGVVGGIAGSVVGTATVKLLQTTPLLRGKIEGEFSVFLFALALIISIGLGAIGGLYPAIRGSRMHPSEALRYE
ncbi:MAG TPA: ABC transporter permease [Candidatus Acidoferrales bacterium]|jgi:putative ABC transport system permease protein|nr:ABC transporter permease [Candidatus Acidoferrales bacterium]